MVYGLDEPYPYSATGHFPDGNVWFGVCLPIKITSLYGVHRKSLEQKAVLMLQTQRTPSVL
jgi:hypothetical protein